MEHKKHVFSCLEKKCFQDIIKKYSSVIENKETDGASLHRKRETWEKITAEYNASPHANSQATTKQLRRLWMNLKQRQRESLTKERRNSLTTGGLSKNEESIDSDVVEAAPAIKKTAIDSVAILDAATQTCVKDTPVFETPKTFNQYLEIPTTTLHHKLKTDTVIDKSQRDSILKREYKDRQGRDNEKHRLEILILKEQLRESRAQADLAELVLKQKRQQSFLGISEL